MTCMKNLKFFILILLVSLAANANAEIINRVYAVVGEKVITQYELETMNPKRLQFIYRKYKGEEQQEQLTKYYLGSLDVLISNYVIEQAAAREGVRVSNREVNGAVKDIMAQNNVDEERLEELLAASNQTLEQYKWTIKIDILKSRLMSTVFNPKIIITEEDITKYVDENAEALELSDQYELRMMRVSSEEELKEVMADFEANGNFRETAMKFSKNANASDGGYLGWVEVSFLDDKIREAILKAKEGITEAIKDDNGYRIFFIEGFKNREEIGDDKRKKIVREMQAEQSKDIFANWLAEKKKEILIQKKYEN